MTRPLATNLTTVPKLFHQFWSEPTLPSKFDEWTRTCREAHPDWEWVLWNVNDTNDLVDRFAPWFAKTYHALESKIVVYRADVSRNLFMHVFGGVYTDLDTECLRSTNTLIEKYGKPGKQAFVAQMGTDPEFEQAIPNAWFASTPGHPFWLLPLEYVKENIKKSNYPEYLTGPAALGQVVRGYNKTYVNNTKALDEHYAQSGWRSLFADALAQADTIANANTNSNATANGNGTQASEPRKKRLKTHFTILPHYEIFPYSWGRDGVAYKEWCSTMKETFNGTRCKRLLGTEEWGSYAISYFSHSWSGSKEFMKGVGWEKPDTEDEGKDEEGAEEVEKGEDEGKPSTQTVYKGEKGEQEESKQSNSGHETGGQDKTLQDHHPLGNTTGDISSYEKPSDNTISQSPPTPTEATSSTDHQAGTQETSTPQNLQQEKVKAVEAPKKQDQPKDTPKEDSEKKKGEEKSDSAKGRFKSQQHEEAKTELKKGTS